MSASALEFSRPIDVADLPAEGRAFAIAASASECARVAARLSVPAVESLQAQGTVAPQGRLGVVRLAGTLTARVRQICVVTLEPFDVTISAALERLYDAAIGDEWADAEDDGGQLVAHVGPDAFSEPLVDARIDVGEAAVEQLALELDPHPRKPGATFAVPTDGGAADARPPASAFAKLASLRRRQPGGPH
jgi:thioesterase domain-containing protein